MAADVGSNASWATTLHEDNQYDRAWYVPKASQSPE